MNLCASVGSSENSWEPEENLDCPDLISDYENRMKKQKRKNETTTSSSSNTSVRSTKKKPGDSASGGVENDEPNAMRGFDRNLQPEKILGATDSSGELMFLMKWKNSDEADLVLAKTANVKCPQIVIQFYEERLTWHTGSDDKEDKSNGDRESNEVSTTRS